ncbi:nitroreductase [Sporomusaceae bacterium BoRhaA]|uniref:nitroreductase family protein n=1 Tax=Pelorhabdus rhamnosifermentans TaxID=2772457 RepID=UPI001C061CDF|nr:nitroreductase family protein [Pelorhabdus rhamnosifermentans]MBU2703366.1 nitroreductase [Pelorhabdus rhamnosifermentans]
MNFINLAAERYSLRKFSDKPIEKEKLDLVLKAGQLAPTAVNFQPQRILVIESQPALTKLKDCTPYHFNAPMALLVCYDKAVSWKRNSDSKDNGDIDASIVATHMMLEAADLGLGTTWVGNFNSDMIMKLFELPKNFVPVTLLPIGYPAEDAKKHSWHSQRVPIGETVFFNDFSRWEAKEIDKAARNAHH